MAPRPARGAWNPAKVAAFEKAFWTFVGHVRINSKEKGGNYQVGGNLYESQRRYLKTIWGGLAEDKHSFKFLKSRQLGISTITELIVSAWLGFHDGMQGAMVFDTAAHSSAARVRIRNVFNSLPDSFGFPRIQQDNRDGFILTNQSVLMFMSAGVRESRSSGVLGRSTGINLLWRSELCSWENIEGIEALDNSLSWSYPDRLYVDESTARNFGIWHEIWTTGKANLLDCVTAFLGWWSKDDQRLERNDRRWELYGEREPTERELKKIRLVKELYDFEISREQLAWYRWRSDPALESDEDEPIDPNFVQDQPWDEYEAFQSVGTSFFRSERLTEDSQKVTHERYQAYRFWPGTDFIGCDVRRASTRREIELKVWEDPMPESTYVVSTDPAFGRDEENDNSAIQVVRCFADGVDQVAEYATATIEPHQLAWLILTLLGWYGSPPRNQVLNICELNGPGQEVWRQYGETVKLIRQGYLRDKARDRGLADIYANVRNFIYTKPDSMSVGSIWQMKTNAHEKVTCMEGFRNNWHNYVVRLRSLELVEEMRTVARKGDSIRAPTSRRDDRTYAMAMAIRGWEERMRRDLVSRDLTRENDRMRRVVSIADRSQMFTKMLIEDMFKRKSTGRLMAMAEAQRRARY